MKMMVMEFRGVTFLFRSGFPLLGTGTAPANFCSINDASSTKEPKTVRSTLANGISSTGPGPNKSGGNEPEPDSRCAPDTLNEPKSDRVDSLCLGIKRIYRNGFHAKKHLAVEVSANGRSVLPTQAWDRQDPKIGPPGHSLGDERFHSQERHDTKTYDEDSSTRAHRACSLVSTSLGIAEDTKERWVERRLDRPGMSSGLLVYYRDFSGNVPLQPGWHLYKMRQMMVTTLHRLSSATVQRSNRMDLPHAHQAFSVDMDARSKDALIGFRRHAAAEASTCHVKRGCLG
ncbi:predicted protein [Plenodomus lingam JN3]|uniref:Predicted protein n=1 Tax=Leptosphaeria maculans (strain JN3 / isolate v23.1.3 / race Av1-4-5-6-7-8) TaxID=985895 RepID=E5AB79_LEPMJ|nr:predicted protein [Plenodomus lingam JN3]CBY00920.1 predicted protein [Plenodomus lingam JN3]